MTDSQTKYPKVLASVLEAGTVLLYFTLPGHFWSLIPEWVKEPNFDNTPKKGRTKAERSDLLFRDEMVSMAKLVEDLIAVGMVPTGAFYLNREGGSRRVRITFELEGEPLTDEQIESLKPLWEDVLYDTMSHRTSPTRFLPEHINVVAGNPFFTSGGGFEAVRVRGEEVCLASILDEDEKEEIRSSTRGMLSEL